MDQNYLDHDLNRQCSYYLAGDLTNDLCAARNLRYAQHLQHYLAHGHQIETR